MHANVKTGLPQMYSTDFLAKACTTSRWLCDEIVNGSPRSPLQMATGGWRSKAVLSGVPAALLCCCGFGDEISKGASAAFSVATAMPVELSRPGTLGAIREDSVRTGTGRDTPIRFNWWTTRSGSTMGPLAVVRASIRTFLFPDICSISFIAISDPGSPRVNLKVSEREVTPEPKETRALVACGAGVQDIWPEFSPKVPKTNRGYPGFMIRSSNRILSAESSPRRATNFRIFSGMMLPLPKRDVCTSSVKLRCTSSSAPCGLINTFPVLSSRKKGTDKLSSNTCSHLWSFPDSTHCQAFTR